MANLILILGSQLHPQLPALMECDKEKDEVIMIESQRQARLHPWHKHKLIFVWASMREFAKQLRDTGYNVNYITADESSQRRFRDLVALRFHQGRFDKLIVTQPTERSVIEHVRVLSKVVPTELRPHNYFLISEAQAHSAPGLGFLDFQKQFRDIFTFTPPFQIQTYTKQLVLNPADTQKELRSQNSAVRQVTSFTEKHFPGYPGDSSEFRWPISAANLQTVIAFADNTNPTFQVTMIENCLNAGIVTPAEVISQYSNHLLALQSLVVREYYRYLYITAPQPLVAATKKLPKAFPDSAPFAEMRCNQQTVNTLELSGAMGELNYLGVLQNLLILSATSPAEIVHWYTQHTLTPAWLAQAKLHHALTSVSVNAANYINRNTGYCADCRYNPLSLYGERACPFNYLFWHFLETYQSFLQDLPNLRTHFKHLQKFTPTEREIVATQAEMFLQRARRQLVSG